MYSPEEIQILIDLYPTNGAAYVAKLVNRSIGSVQQKVRRLGLSYIKPKVRTCGVCKQEFPKTEEYFFTRVIRQKNSKGEKVEYPCLRSSCKKCHSFKGYQRYLQKRCKELGCTAEEYKATWQKQLSEALTLDIEARKNLNPVQYSIYLKFLRNDRATNYKEYLEIVKQSRLERNQRLREMVFSKQKYFTPEQKKAAKRGYQRQNHERLTNATVANTYLNRKVGEVPLTLIQAKRAILLIKREIRNM